MEKIFQLILEGHTTGIKINGIPINNLRYANNTILAENIQELQIILNTIKGKNIVLTLMQARPY